MPQDDTQLAMPWIGNRPPASTVTLPVPPQHGYQPDALLAPPPAVDRYPIVIGAPLRLDYITAQYRNATMGWRYGAVDVWNELLEHDPHSRGVIRQRLLPVVAARMDVVAAELAEDALESDKQLAKTIRNEVKRQLSRIPARTQAFGRLMWGVPYGMSACENDWDRDSSSPAPKGWEVQGLRFIHSRRLNCTNPNSLDVYVYDQGPMSPLAGGNYAAGLGLRMASFPGKFTLHCPALNGDYALRDGELRYVGVYLALKRMIVRCAAQDFERVIRPWVLGYFNREGDKSRVSVAAQQDINQLKSVLAALGMGSLNSAVLPDAVRVDLLKHVASAGNPREFAAWLDTQITESFLGQSYTTGPSQHGTHEAAGVAAQGTLKIHEYDAQCLADTLERDVVRWIVELNWGPQIAKRFAPTIRFAVSDTPDPKRIADVAKILTAIDVELDARKVGEMAGMPVIAPGDDDTPRTRVVVAGPAAAGPIEPAGDDPNDPDAEAPADEATTTPEPPPAPKPAAKPARKAIKKPSGGSGSGGAGASGKDKGEPDGQANKAMADRGAFLLSDAEVRDDVAVLCAIQAAPVSTIGDRDVAAQVYEHLLEDYPAKSLGWIPKVGPWHLAEVPVDEIDFDNANKWRASHEDITPYVEKIRKAGGDWKPIVLVKRPNSDKLMIVDGHHRTLAYKTLGWPVKAYVAHVPTVTGDWDTLHDLQKKSSSKGSWADENSPSWTASQMPSWGKRPGSYQGAPPHPAQDPNAAKA